MKSINYTMAVGAVTSKIIFNMLSENGVHEAALRTAINTEEPSIGYWWKRWNATTCYEAFPAANDASSEFPCSLALHCACHSQLRVACPFVLTLLWCLTLFLCLLWQIHMER